MRFLPLRTQQSQWRRVRTCGAARVKWPGNYHAAPLVQIWSNDLTISLLHSADMRPYNWSYTQFSQFNQDDSLLLASGVFLGPHNSSSGEIAVISLGECGHWVGLPHCAPVSSMTSCGLPPRLLRPAVPCSKQAL